MASKECKKAYLVRITDYYPEKEFDKKYKVQIEDKNGNIIFFTNDIKNFYCDFEILHRDYTREIYELKAKIEAYKDIIHSFEVNLKESN